MHGEPKRGKPEPEGKDWKGLLTGLFDGVPDKDKFLKMLAKRLDREPKDGEDQPKFEGFFDDKLLLASFLTQELGGRKERDELIANIVEASLDSENDSELYDAVLDLPFSDIVTTNYDSNIDRFFTRKGYAELTDSKKKGEKESAQKPPKGYVEIIDSKSIAMTSRGEGCSRVFYLHGKVGKCPLVFDKFDYATLQTERDGILEYVTFLLRDSHVIYVGFGLDDPTFNQMETRLNALHGQDRPPSFAFLKNVTEKEREVWKRRNLQIIDCDEFADIPQIITWVDTIRKFVRWAEPDLDCRKGALPNDDRTRGYWNETLKLYVRGAYEESMVNCRAALASTLFWENERGRRVMPFDRAMKVVEIRIRMALNHYKLSWVSKEQNQTDERIDATPLPSRRSEKKLMEENIDGAELVLKEQSQRVHLSKKEEALKLALENSLKILRARVLYHRDKFLEAERRYKEVIESVPEELRTLHADDNDRDTIITKLRLAEGFYYSHCQLSRIEYQLIDRSIAERQKGREEQVRRMIDTEKKLEEICGFLKDKEENCKKFQEWEYFQSSLWTIRRISRWTAGRHAVRVCKDLIPTRVERNEDSRRKLDDALVYLSDELQDVTRLTNGKKPWLSSPRWPALRCRYQCRAYALRWIVDHGSGHGRPSDEDICEANASIQKAFQQASGRGLERQQMVNLLEAARLHVLVGVGERLRSLSRDKGVSMLTLGAGLNYLDQAFKTMRQDEGDKWLMALGYRLASYFALVAGACLDAGMKQVSEIRLRTFLEAEPKSMPDKVEEQYRSVAETLGDRTILDRRIRYYRESFDKIEVELSEDHPAEVARRASAP